MNIQELWAAKHIPIISGIYFASGEVHTLVENYESVGDSRIGRGEVINIDRISLNKEVLYTSIDPSFEAVFLFNSRSIKVYCGEGGFGSDGFVCLTEGDIVLWLAFFEYSNPFVRADQNDRYLTVKNNCDEKWVFPIDYPQDVSVALSTQ